MASSGIFSDPLIEGFESTQNDVSPSSEELNHLGGGEFFEDHQIQVEVSATKKEHNQFE